MKRAIAILLVAACAPLLLSSPAGAGPVLDRLLNNMVLDTSNGGFNRRDFKILTAESPLGQTFTTGPKTVEISRIAVSQACWHESWTPDESMVLTLYDSPAKTNQIASAEMPYKWKDWEGPVIMFTLNVKAEPSTQYYFELTARGGDGKIVGFYTAGKYEGGQAYEGGKPVDRNIWFEIHSRPVFDRDAAYADRFSLWNLDYAGLEKVKAAVAARDWDEAVDELIAYYESRPELVSAQEKPKKNPDFDTTLSELLLDKKIKADDGSIVDLGPNWNHYREWPTRGGVGLTRTGLFKRFRSGYMNTADEKYVVAFNEFMINFLDDMPSPLRAGVIEPGAKNLNAAPPGGLAGCSMWAGLSTAARMNQMWFYYSTMHASPNFTRDVRTAWIFNMVDMAVVLSMQKGGGNWDSQMSTALYELADRHPELADSREWFDQGLTAMYKNLMSSSRADGSIQEPTFGYTTLIINRFIRMLDTCRKLSIPLEPKYEKRVERTIEYLMYSTEPDGLLPSRGDTFNFAGSAGQLGWAADYYDRDDFRWVASRGEEGIVPLRTSAFFPIGGWCVMRSDWSPDGLYLNLHNGRDWAHGHYDQLSITVDAFRNKLIVDPGCYIYGTPYHRELSKSRHHATVTVDDADSRVGEMGSNAWASMDTLDYFEGTHAGYSGVKGVLHTRKIAFLKPDYWLVRDTVTGEGEHEVASRYPFYPGEVELDPATGACRTQYAGGNILIMPCPGPELSSELSDYNFPFPPELEPAKSLKYSKTTALPITFAALLMPYKGSAAPQPVLDSIGENAYAVTTKRTTDYIAFGDTTSPEIEFAGTAAAVRTDGARITSLAWVDGVSASYRGIRVASAAEPVRHLELVYDGDTLRIYASREDPTLEVAALGARYFTAGNRCVERVAGGVIRPFAE